MNPEIENNTSSFELDEKGNRIVPRDASPSQTTTSPSRAPNEKAKVTKAQQWKIWTSCSLQCFWVMGINQSFGIFQAYYGSDKAVKAGIIRPQEETCRAGIAAIQSLGNGGIVAIFAILFFSRLPSIGNHIRTLCWASATLTALGFAGAAASNTVSGVCELGVRADDCVALAASLDSRLLCRYWQRCILQCTVDYSPGILWETLWSCTGVISRK